MTRDVQRDFDAVWRGSAYDVEEVVDVFNEIRGLDEQLAEPRVAEIEEMEAKTEKQKLKIEVTLNTTALTKNSEHSMWS